MSRTSRAAFSFTAAVLIGFSAAVVAARDWGEPSMQVIDLASHRTIYLQQDVDVTGTWSFTVQTSAGSGTPTITFKQDGAKLTGTYEGQFGKAPLEGTLDGRKIQFKYTVQVDGQPAEVVYQGTVESATAMKGTVDFGGGALTGSFTAEKKAPAAK